MASIRKVKVKPGTVEIHTESNIGKNEKITVHKSFEEPHPALVNALADAVKSVFHILEWDRSYAAGAVKVTGVSFSESESGVRGAVITGQVALNTADSPFCFNTPHLPFEPYAQGAGGRIMEKVDVERMELILDEAQKFLDGKRAPSDQVEMSFKPSGICTHCGGDIAIANPTGICNHIQWPDHCEVCKENASTIPDERVVRDGKAAAAGEGQ